MIAKEELASAERATRDYEKTMQRTEKYRSGSSNGRTVTSVVSEYKAPNIGKVNEPVKAST